MLERSPQRIASRILLYLCASQHINLQDRCARAEALAEVAGEPSSQQLIERGGQVRYRPLTDFDTCPSLQLPHMPPSVPPSVHCELCTGYSCICRFCMSRSLTATGEASTQRNIVDAKPRYVQEPGAPLLPLEDVLPASMRVEHWLPPGAGLACCPAASLAVGQGPPARAARPPASLGR